MSGTPSDLVIATVEHPNGRRIELGAVPHVAGCVARNESEMGVLMRVLGWAALPDAPPHVVILRDGEVPIELAAVSDLQSTGIRNPAQQI